MSKVNEATSYEAISSNASNAAGIVGAQVGGEATAVNASDAQVGGARGAAGTPSDAQVGGEATAVNASDAQVGGEATAMHASDAQVGGEATAVNASDAQVGGEATAVNASDAAGSARRGRARRWLCGLTLAILGVAVGGDALAQQVTSGNLFRGSSATPYSSGMISGADNLTVSGLRFTVGAADVRLVLDYDETLLVANGIGAYSPANVFGTGANQNTSLATPTRSGSRPNISQFSIPLSLDHHHGPLSFEITLTRDSSHGGGTITTTISMQIIDPNAPRLLGAEIRRGGARISSGALSADNMTVSDLTIDESDDVTLHLSYNTVNNLATPAITTYMPSEIFRDTTHRRRHNPSLTATVQSADNAVDIPISIYNYFSDLSFEVRATFSTPDLTLTTTVNMSINDVNGPPVVYSSDDVERYINSERLAYILEDGPLVTTRAFPRTGRQSFVFFVDPLDVEPEGGVEEEYPITISLVENPAIAEVKLLFCPQGSGGTFNSAPIVIGTDGDPVLNTDEIYDDEDFQAFLQDNNGNIHTFSGDRVRDSNTRGCVGSFTPNFDDASITNSLTITNFDSNQFFHAISMAVRPAADVAGIVTATVAVKDGDLDPVFYDMPFVVYAAEDTPRVLTSQDDLDLGTGVAMNVWTTLQAFQSITLSDADIEARFVAAERVVGKTRPREREGLSSVDRLADDASVVISVDTDDSGVRDGVELRLETTVFGSLTAVMMSTDTSVGVWTIEFNDDNRISRDLSELTEMFQAIEYRDTFATAPTEARSLAITYFDGADTSLDRRDTQYHDNNELSFTEIPNPPSRFVAFAVAAGVEGLPASLTAANLFRGGGAAPVASGMLSGISNTTVSGLNITVNQAFRLVLDYDETGLTADGIGAYSPANVFGDGPNQNAPLATPTRDASQTGISRFTIPLNLGHHRGSLSFEISLSTAGGTQFTTTINLMVIDPNYPRLTGAEIRRGGAVISRGAISGDDNLMAGDLSIDENDSVTLRLTYNRNIDSAVSISNYTPFGIFGTNDVGQVINSEWTARPRPPGREADIAFRVTRFFGTITVEVPMNFGGGTIATATVSVTVNDANDPVSLYATDSQGRFPVLPYVLEDGPLVTTRSFPRSNRQAFLFIVEPSVFPLISGNEEAHPITISLVDNSAIAEARLVHCTDADFGLIGGFVLGNCASGFDPDFANNGSSDLTLDSPARRNAITVAVRPSTDVVGPVTAQMAIKDDDLPEVTFSLPFAVYAAEDAPTVRTPQASLALATPTPMPLPATPRGWRPLRSLRFITIHDADVEARFVAAARNSTRVLAGLSNVDRLADDASVSISLILEDFPSGNRASARDGVSLRLRTTEFGSLTATFNAGSGAQAGTWTIEFNADNRISRGLTELSQVFRAIEYRDTFAASTPVMRRFEITYSDGADTSVDPRAVPYSNGLSFAPVPTPAPQAVAFTAAAGVVAVDVDGIPIELEEMIDGLDPDETDTPEDIRRAVAAHCRGGYFDDSDRDGVPNNVEAALGTDCRDADEYYIDINGMPPRLSFGATLCAGDSGAYCAPGAGVATEFNPQVSCVGADGSACEDVRPFFATESCLRNGGDAFGGEITDDDGEVVDPAASLGVLAIGNPPGCQSAGSRTQLNLPVGETRIAWFAVDALGNWVVADGGAVIQRVRVGALLEFNGETTVEADEATVVMVSVTTHGAPLPTPPPQVVIASGRHLPANLPRVGALASVANNMNNMENVWSYEAEMSVNLPPSAVFTLGLPAGIFETSRTPNYYTEAQANQGWTITAMVTPAPFASIELRPLAAMFANSMPPGILAADVVAGEEPKYQVLMSADLRGDEIASVSIRLALLVAAPSQDEETPSATVVQTIDALNTLRGVANLNEAYSRPVEVLPPAGETDYEPVTTDLQVGDSAGTVSVRLYMPSTPMGSTPLRFIADFAVVSSDASTTRALRAHYPIVPATINGVTFEDFIDLIDADGDGVPNRIETRNGIAEGSNGVLHAAEGELPLRTENEPGLTLRLGEYAANYFAARVPDEVVGTPPGYADSGVYDFRLDLPAAGAVGRVVIPLPSTMTRAVAYYKYRSEGLDWVPFVIGDGDGVFWAPRLASGGCPSPSSLTDWRAAAQAGDRCVLLVIRDGGANDDDEEANRIVVDPGAVGAARGGGGSGGGGGLVSLPMLLALLLFVGLAARRARRAPTSPRAASREASDLLGASQAGGASLTASSPTAARAATREASDLLGASRVSDGAADVGGAANVEVNRSSKRISNQVHNQVHGGTGFASSKECAGAATFYDGDAQCGRVADTGSAASPRALHGFGRLASSEFGRLIVGERDRLIARAFSGFQRPCTSPKASDNADVSARA